MLKKLAIFALLCSTVLGCTQEPFLVNRNQQEADSQPRKDAASPSKPSLGNVSDTDKENADNAKRYAYYKAHPKEYLKVSIAPANLSNWILAILGVIGAGVAVFTLVILNRQTNHIVASERAWVTVTPSDGSPELYPAWEPGSTAPPANPVMHRIPLTVQNLGKTPARIDEAAFHYVRIASLKDLPIEPNYGPLTPQGGHWIIPNDKHNSGADLETDHGILYQRHIEDLELRRAYLFAFGIMKYRDAFGKRHETRVGYVYHFPIKGIASADGKDLSKPYFRIDGPPAYNRAT